MLSELTTCPACKEGVETVEIGGCLSRSQCRTCKGKGHLVNVPEARGDYYPDESEAG